MTNASSAGRGGQFIRLAYLAAGVVWLTVSLLPRGATLIYLWPWPLVLTVALLVPAGMLAGRLAAGAPVPRLGGLADWAILGLLLAHAAAAVLSPYRSASLGMILLPLAALCLPYELQRWRRDDPEAGDIVAGALAWMLVLFTTVSLVMWFTLIAWPNGLAHLWAARNPHPLGHSNYTAGALLILLPFGLARLAATTGRVRLGWIGAAVAALFCLFTAGSRAALIGLVAGAAVAGLLLVRSGQVPVRRALLLVALGVAGIGVFALVNPRIREMLNPAPTGIPDDSTLQRAAMRDAGRLMIAERPIFGWGPGTTPLVYPRFRRELSGGVDTALQLHNAPLQLAADTGLAGLASMLLLLGAGAWSCWRLCGPSPTGGGRPIAAMAGIAVVAYGAFAIYDFELDVPFFPVAGAVCVALLFPSSPAGGVLPRWPSFVVAMAGLGLTVGPRIPQLYSHYLLSKASDALEDGDTATFDALAVRASKADRTATQALNALAFQFGERFRRTQDPATKAHLETEGELFFTESLFRNPFQEICQTNLGWLRLASAPAEAEENFLAAAALVPEKEGLGVGLAFARLAASNRPGTVGALASECLIDPRFLLSPLWRDAPLSELRPAVLAAVSGRASALAPDPACRPWQRAELLYLGSFAGWLAGRIPPADVARVALNPDQREFFSTGRPGQFLELLAAAKPDEILRFRSRRPGYGVLMRNLDEPMPVDFYESYHYRAVVKEYAFLLPERLNLPGHMLLSEFVRGSPNRH